MCGFSLCGALADSGLVASRASVDTWSISTPAACLLLRQFVPAVARLCAEYGRLRVSLPPAQAQTFAGFEADSLPRADLTAAVRMSAFPASRTPKILHRHKPCTSAARDVQGMSLDCEECGA